MIFKRPDPDDIFTPRSPDVNPSMYVHRRDLEVALLRALAGTKNIVVSGESGSGKTWLYKRVLSDNNVHYELINLANASLKGGLEAAFKDKIDRQGNQTRTQRKKAGGLKVEPVGIGVNASGEFTYTIGQKSAFESILQYVRERAGKKNAILVYDNFEQIADKPEVIKAISDTIILLDDDDLSKYRVKLCIVGVP